MNYCAFKADIWSAGVILFECLFGYKPFDDNDISILMKKITSCNLVFPS